MSIGGRGFLEADDGLRELAFEIMLVELTEHFFELPGGAAGLHGLFHDFSPLYVKIAKRRDRWYNVLVPLRNSPLIADYGKGSLWMWWLIGMTSCILRVNVQRLIATE